MKISISDFFKSSKNDSAKSYVADGVNFQSKSYKSYSSVEDCEVAMNCIRIIQDEVIKSIPRHEIDGITQNDDLTILFKQPNFFMDTIPFLKQVIYHYLINNNAYILKVYDKSANIVSLLPISPLSAEFLQDGRGGYFYRFKFPNSKDIPDADIEAWRVIHLKRDITDDAYFGSSSYGSDNDLLELVNTYRVLSENLRDSTSSTPNLIFKYDELAKASDYEKDAKNFLSSIKKNKYGVLSPNVVLQDTSKMSNSQFASVEMLKFYKQEICNHFRVSESIFDNSANEEEYRAFYNRTIKPILAYLSIAFTNAFFTPTQQKKGHKIVFAQDDMSLLSHKERIELFESVQHSSSVKVDEQRAFIGLPALENGAGNVIMVQLDAVKEKVGEDNTKETNDNKEEVSNDE